MFGGKSKSSSPSNKKNDSNKSPPGLNDGGGGLNDLIEDIDMNQIDGMLKKDIREDDITLTEDDMDDPELLSQLSQIESGRNLVKPQQHQQPQQPQAAAPKKLPAPPPQVAKKKQLTKEEEEERMLMEFGDGDDMPSIEDDDDVDFEEQIATLKERIVNYKRAAMAANQGGDKTKAVNLMRSVKLLEQAISELEDGIPVDTKSLPPPIAATVTIAPTTPTTRPSGNSSPTATSSSASSSASSSLRSTPVTSLSPPVRSPPKVETMSKEKVEQEERLATWELFEEEYKKKHQSLTSEALKLKTIDKHKAVVLYKESKSIQVLIDQIEICKNAISKPPPYHYEDKVTQTEIIVPHLKETELEILIGKIELPKAAGAVDTYIQAELPYPSAEQPIKFQTGTTSASTANYNYKTIVQIERKKTLQRVLEKKKLSLTITSSKMFFMKSVIGRCEVKLSDLLDKCEYFEKSPILKEGSKKEIGGYVEVIIRMKTPLNGKEYKKSSERVLVIDGDLGNIDTTASTTTTTTTNTSLPKDPVASTTTVQPSQPSQPPSQPKPLAPAPTTSKPAPPPVTAPAAAAVEDDEDEDVEDLNHIISNDVFEFMLNSVNQQIAQSGAKPDLLDKKQALEIKQMVLETQVDSGMLTVEGYMKQLEEAIIRDKKWAQKLVKEGKKEKAMKIMRRVKIMEAEVSSSNEE
ncbi:hypothetical protein DFA_10960 [Cavenderia fasciculata]|uniref:DM14 domain-containing protein n=1 Tax=Cavenderia fasciculata TaxID=261658 RepID=F4QBW4_CACFS|nr:uncharacterized protein DFA_10960 [Cavenderia fasciculata]EGG14702.1 hypothetical protein DFA_10960 [Cavenderia fasciculata]|eukprot:XP_004351210.1 hypothetical protein DFA_10960 [Cavenderia fasciculata]